MAIIDPEGLFGGDRLRRCSNTAQLHWPRLFLASDGFARLEISYARIIGRAYPTFNPVPSEQELQGLLKEYAQNYLLFLFEVDGQTWGQWDTRLELLPRYKTAQDRRSPIPPEPAFSGWKKRYREERKGFPKSFGNISETFLHGVGVGGGGGEGVGKNICPSPENGDGRVGVFSLIPLKEKKRGPRVINGLNGMTTQQSVWFAEWWAIYWRRVAVGAARKAFRDHVTTEARFGEVMRATRAQTAEMVLRDKTKRPHGATWLNAERWTDEIEAPKPPASARNDDDYPELVTR